MKCSLHKYKKETATHYVSNSGDEYPINKYQNWGGGIEKRNKKDLPKDGYPYTIKYKIELKFLCCKLCDC